MLFHIHDSIKALAGQENAPEFLVDFTEELFRARRMGRHIIFSKPETLDALAKLNGLSTRTVQTIKTIRGRLRSKKTLFEKISTFVRVVAEENIKKRITEGQQNILEISARFLISDISFRETTLLVENQTDGEFYKIITQIYNNLETPSGSIRLNLSIFPGGGSQTPRHYDLLKMESRLTLCIVDGDIEFEGSDLGTNTAKPIKNSDLTTPSTFAESLIIHCYSIENLIPPTLIRVVNGLGGIKVPWLKNLEDLSTSTMWPYLPLKQKKKCSAFRGSSPKSVYWRQYKESFSPTHPICENWHEDDNCDEPCIVFDGVSSKTLEKVVEYLRNLDSDKMSNELTTVIKELPAPVATMWKQVAKGVTSWGCSGQRLAVV
ncbi:hypothetical protein [Burkholderia lata]|uniref:hypothetical protein n=1 Tax=Burkholderia lata (strain ATCC 17760 / DSM 23089 / LMG 22485 / NCIMB 9086 / R18194 / 383) TaxID=482957 RepID=UPI00145406DF|nr:hypothetical protein [Burkholderia lata]VWM06455.1 hypothetical protein BLA6992_02337 [Burkholderia lata]